MKFAKDAVLERAAIVSYLQGLAEVIAERGLKDADPEAALTAGGLKAAVGLLATGEHMDLLKDAAQQEVLPVDMTKSVVGSFRDETDLPN